MILNYLRLFISTKTESEIKISVASYPNAMGLRHLFVSHNDSLIRNVPDSPNRNDIWIVPLSLCPRSRIQTPRFPCWTNILMNPFCWSRRYLLVVQDRGHVFHRSRELVGLLFCHGKCTNAKNHWYPIHNYVWIIYKLLQTFSIPDWANVSDADGSGPVFRGEFVDYQTNNINKDITFIFVKVKVKN